MNKLKQLPESSKGASALNREMNTKMKKLIFYAVLITFITACNRVDNTIDSIKTENSKILDKNYIRNAKLSEQLEYKKHYLKEAGKLIKELGITSKDLVDLAIEANNRGQQKNTFLLNDIVKYANTKNKIISKEMQSKIDELSDVFNGLDERDYNISIYIPFAEKLKSATSTNKGANDEIFIFEQEDKTDTEYFEGYVLNEDGEYVTYEDLINEEMAENFATTGKAVIIIGAQGGTFNPDDGGTAISSYPFQSFGFYKMAIKADKETWIAGKAEVTIKVLKEKNGYQRVNYLNCDGCYPEYTFRKWSNSEVSNQTLITLDNRVTFTMDRSEPDVIYNYVIYESDNWPTDTRYAYFNNNGITRQIEYGSSQTEYDHGSFTNDNLNPFVFIENSDIKYSRHFR